ncbi:hypothetical protein GH714_024599 [Hevea brasiliensis]|uniref:Disease resistance protein At4g27190-like leucine-rich repeats domain-containing protein n=1 Tax=Hevea brasiliensis TaxID=3981 RepID=A0A6A6L0I8_HEVBR|nr:hypothetical protein GH714_024599 [Hevea brasiliensis]
MGDGFVQWKGEGHDEPRNNANLSELKLLSKLSTLEVHIMDANIMPKDLFSEKLERFRVFIGDEWDWDWDWHEYERYADYRSLRTLKLKLSRSALLERVKVLLMKTEDLYLDDLRGLRSVLYELDDQGLGKLEEVDVSSCEIMEEIAVEEGEDDEEINLTQIRSLTLDNLPQLTSFCSQGQEKVCSASERTQKEAAVGTSSKEIVCEDEIEAPLPLFSKKIGFPNLEDIKLCGINVKMIWPNQHIESSLYIEKLTTLIVDGCGNLNYLFTSSIVGSLAQLKTLEICECKSMEEVIIAEGEGEMMSKMLFPKLHSLKLKGLPRIVRFCTANLIECPSLKVLRVDNCPHLHAFLSTCTSKNVGTSSGVTQANATLFDEKVWFPNLEELYIMRMHKLEMIWCDELLADSFSRLKVLQVQYGKQLLKIFPSKLLGRFLQNLELLVVKNCDSVEEVFDLRALVRVSEAPVVERSQLRTLDIRDLPNLKQVWNMDPHGILSFYNLRQVYAWNCPKLKSLFPFSIALGLPHLALLNIKGCGMEEVVAKEESVEAITINPKFVFRGLKALVLWELEELRCFYSEKHSLECTQLKHLCVCRCEKLKTFNLESGEMQEILMDGQESQLKIQVPQPLFAFREVGFSGLQHLELSQFPELKAVWQDKLPFNFFYNLSRLVVDECMFPSSSVPSGLLPILDNLDKLEVRNCDFMKEVFGTEWENANSVVGHLPKLNELDLINLPMLRIHNCSSLRNIFTPTICSRLEQLQVLEVKSCAMVKTIITEGIAKEESTEEIIFPLLNSITLESLPNLINFKSGSGTVHFPSLKEITLADCPTTFNCSFFKEATPNANDGIIEPKVFFPNLKDLKLSSTKVEMIWHAQQLEICSYTQNLTSLIIDGCGNLKYFLSPSSVVHLKRLEICNCKIMEEVMVKEGLEEEIVTKMLLHQLESLKLKDLPKLTRFCTSTLVECPALKELCIQNCPQMTTFVSNYATSNMASGSGLEIISPTLFDEKVAFPNLEQMQILNMDNLKMIWHNELHSDSFCKMKVLEVKYCEELLKIFPSMLLRDLQNLGDLVIWNCISLKEAFDLQELIKMKETVAIQLRTLYIANLPNLKHVWNEDPLGLVLFHNLSSVHVMDCPNLKFIFPASIAKNLPQLETLHIRSCGVEEIVAQDQGLEATSEFVFPCLKFLTFGELYELKCFYPGIHTLESPMLKSLAVNHCEEVNIFCSEYENLVETNKECQLMTQVLQPLFSFRKIVPNLEQLTLTRKDVTIIWQNQFPADLFRKLKVVEIHCFHDESVVFPFHLLERFRCMEKLVVACSQFKELFSYEGSIGKEKYAEILRQIRHLELLKLPDLTDIWNQDSQLDYVLQPLEDLVVSECNSLITLAPSSASFQNLTTLDVWKCNGLVGLLTSSTAKSLVRLTIMIIKECDGLKEVVANEGEESKEDIIFSKLESLEFDCLPSLISFCSADHSFKFPSLTKVIVKQCPKMQVFSKGVLSTPRLLGIEKDNQWHWNGNLNAAVQQLFAETVCAC